MKNDKLTKTKIKSRENDCSLKRLYVFKTGEHYDALVPDTKLISGNDEINVTLAGDDKNNVRCLQNPQGFSHFSSPRTVDTKTVGSRKGNMENDYMNEIVNFRNSFPKNLISGHLNINGLRNKFFEIHDILKDNLLDLFFISETKLDSSFPNAQFQVPGFKYYRVDRNAHGGGIAAYIRSDLPHRRRPDLESVVIAPVEAFVIEVIILNEVWLDICMYSPHSKHKMACCGTIDAIIDACQSKRPTNIFVFGDLNINCLSDTESRCLKDVMDVFGLCNLIDTPPCYKSVDLTLIDVILTSQRRRIASTLNVTTGISDFHNLIACSTKIHVPRNGNKILLIEVTSILTKIPSSTTLIQPHFLLEIFLMMLTIHFGLTIHWFKILLTVTLPLNIRKL